MCKITYVNEMLQCHRKRERTNVFLDLYLSDVGRGNPFLVQEICGVGEPLQLHLRHTGGPGWRVCSINSYTRYGAASEIFLSSVGLKYFCLRLLQLIYALVYCVTILICSLTQRNGYFVTL